VSVVSAARRIAGGLAGLAIVAAAGQPAAGQEAGKVGGFRLAFPMDCTLGETCWLQNLVDVDPGPQARDHRCGPWTYDGHRGTDVRLKSVRAMRQGVDVLAPADGVVARVRDGMADRAFGEPAPDVEGRECGNGLVIDHGGGWQTQLCHLRRGSLAVGPGERVARGDRVGEVGASGAADFVHLHLTLRRDGAVVDPFTAFVVGEEPCGEAGESLWVVGAFDTDVPPAQIINAGFAAGPIEMADIENGTVPVDRLRRDQPALVVFGRAANVRPGDRHRLTISGPGVALTDTSDPVGRHRAQSMRFFGTRAPEEGLAPGVYRGTYEVVREGDVIDSESVTLTLE